MSSKNRKALLAQVDKRWLGAGLAAAGAAAAADQANAAIVYHAPVGGITIPSTFGGAYINLENEVSGSDSSTPGWDVNPYGISYMSIYVDSTGAGLRGSSATTYDNLSPGDLICSTDTYRTQHGVGPYGMDSDAGHPLVLNSANNLLGFRFQDASLTNRFGWMRISLGALDAGAQPRTLVEWAYQDDPQVCIGAGVTPEPSSLALLAAGALGLITRRRRTA